MMGSKARIFTPITAVSLEELVPANHFYRHLDRVVDLSFVRDLVKETYAERRRPSIDPVVFFKLQLVMFFDGIRSERHLMQLSADRLSVRWFGLSATIWMSRCLTIRASHVFVSAMASSCSSASLRRLSTSVSKQDWSGAKSFMWTRAIRASERCDGVGQ